ncbi:hypothetical protein LPB140_08110 [Sphingorhabdus lutea]|uniref:GGDEF domain-containing protein n=1 Tax=Sphingorhabdus lutea TaxID=1913578 RepID=A0A1L3JCA7_9SPHN|nr:GGDEF domain-containing phosphodiesterase [Sphingorhabdus lutea]APG62758.1 hypothetical protein LPB140_08110 [Sphingorhabdus lutea]
MNDEKQKLNIKMSLGRGNILIFSPQYYDYWRDRISAFTSNISEFVLDGHQHVMGNDTAPQIIIMDCNFADDNIQITRKICDFAEVNNISIFAILNDEQEMSSIFNHPSITYFATKQQSDQLLFMQITKAILANSMLRSYNGLIAIDDSDGIDVITNLPSAAAIKLRLSSSPSEIGHKSYQVNSGLILLSLENLKQYNEDYGIISGNILLKQVGQKLNNYIKNNEKIILAASRIAGHQIILITKNDMDEAGLQSLSNDMIQLLDGPYQISQNDAFLSIICGATKIAPDEDGLTAMRRANLALAEAHNNGTIFEYIAPRGEDRINLSPQTAIDLKEAIKNNEIAIMFQPIFDVKSGALIAAEALARWHHPRHGIMGAEALFDIAERINFKNKLSDHLQFLALSNAAKWPKPLSNIRLSLNVTPAELAAINFENNLLDRIEDTGFNPLNLTVEITEDAVVANPDKALKKIKILKSKGVKLAIDDFGLGYGNIAQVKSLEPDLIKVDRSLVLEIEGDERDRILLKSVISLGKAMNVDVIVEGIEDEGQLNILKSLSCDYYQGFYGSIPLNINDFQDFAIQHIASQTST